MADLDTDAIRADMDEPMSVLGYRRRLQDALAEIDALRAAVAAVAALLPDSPPFGMVRVVDIWDALHDVTEHKCSAGVSVKHEPPAAPEQFCTRKNDVCDFPDCSCVRREPEDR